MRSVTYLIIVTNLVICRMGNLLEGICWNIKDIWLKNWKWGWKIFWIGYFSLAYKIFCSPHHPSLVLGLFEKPPKSGTRHSGSPTLASINFMSVLIFRLQSCFYICIGLFRSKLYVLLHDWKHLWQQTYNTY